MNIILVLRHKKKELGKCSIGSSIGAKIRQILERLQINMKLEGVREKVFLDRYSLKDKDGNPMEKTPDEMWKRVAKGISGQEKKANRKVLGQEILRNNGRILNLFQVEEF